MNAYGRELRIRRKVASSRPAQGNRSICILADSYSQVEYNACFLVDSYSLSKLRAYKSPDSLKELLFHRLDLILAENYSQVEHSSNR